MSHHARFGVGAALLVATAGGCLGRTTAPKARPAVLAAEPGGQAVVLGSRRTPGGIELVTSFGVLRVSAPRADAFRLQLAKSKADQPPPSFAIDATALAASVTPQVEESDSLILLRTASAILRIDKQPLRVSLLDISGRVVAEDLARTSFDAVGVSVDFALAPGEHIFGLGDKARGFDRRGGAFELWNTDAFGWKVDADPLYKSIPFLLSLRDGRAHGIFIDHPSRATVDVGKTRADTLSYVAKQGTALDVYVFAAGEPRQVMEAYTALTGRTPLPPLWALGHHQSRYGYMSEQDVRAVVTRMQKDEIPLDAVWLDIDFQAENAPFTVNRQAFPSFGQMVKDFDAAGVATVVITDMHVKSYQGKPSVGYAPYDSGAAGDHFVHGPKGFFEGPVWPGQSVFPEFTRQSTRAWWGGLYRDFVDSGVAGFWNDMNEPAVFVKDKTFPEDTKHRLDDGRSLSHTLVHNAYGSLNARATYEGLRQLRPDERPFVLTRAAYAGVQKFAASWTGDNTADRSHLAVTIPQLLNLGISGYPFNGADVGGFVGCPDKELFAEWMELGALQPFFRNHSKKDACRREPWLFGAAIEARARKAVEQRYRLLPYLYTLFEETARNGAPIMRPLWFEFPNDPSIYEVDTAYMLGPDLLVAPKLRAGASKYQVQLPIGEWYDTTTLALVEGGKHEITLAAGESLRVFARAGAIIPEAPVVQSAHRAPAGPLVVSVWPGSSCAGSVYADDGHSFAYQRGESLRSSFTCEHAKQSISVAHTESGRFTPWWTKLRLEVHDIPRRPTSVMAAKGSMPFDYDAAKKTLTLTQPRAEFRVDILW